MRICSLTAFWQACLKRGKLLIPLGIYMSMLLPETSSALQRIMQVQMDTVWIDESTTLQGITASFPYYVMSRIKVYDEKQHYVPRLASRDRWLFMNDLAENGEPIRNIWRTTLEYHVENPAIPDNPNIKQQPDYFAVTEVRMYDHDLSVMLVMDYSTSMDDISVVEESTLNLIEESAGRDPIGVIKFSDSVKVCQTFTQNYQLLRAAIQDSMIYRKDTSLYGAIDSAVCQLTYRPGRRVVVVYTDGKNDDYKVNNSISLDDVILHAQEHQVELYVIGLGGGIDESILKRLASESNGKYYFGQDPQRLEPIFLQIYGDLRGYYIMRHMSTDPFQNGTWRWVEAEVIDVWKGGTGRCKYRVPYYRADVRVSKSVAADSVIQRPNEKKFYSMASDTVTYTIHIENRGKGAYSMLDITDILDDSLVALTEGMVMDDDIALKSYSEHQVIWEVERLDAKAKIQIQYKAKLDPVMPIDPMSLMNQVQLSGDSAITIGSAHAHVLGYGHPDLYVQCISPTFVASPTQTVEIQATIHNQGNAIADRPFRVSFEYEGQVLAYDTLQTLDIGVPAQISGRISFPAWGDYQILVRADADESVEELDESNNTNTCVLHVQLTALDMQISDVNYREMIRGVTGKFPARLLTTVNIWDQNQFPVHGLSESVTWSGLQSQTPAGVLLEEIWTSLNEVNEDNPGYPPVSDVRTGLKAIEFQNSNSSWILMVSTGNVSTNWFETVRPALLSLCERLKSNDRMAVMAADQSSRILQSFTANINLAKQGVNSLSQGSMLHLWDGLVSAVDLAASQSGRNGVLAVIGGEDQGSSSTMTQAYRHALESGVPVYVISLQNNPGMDSLSGMAEASGGAIWQFKDTTTLRVALEGAERSLRNYYVLQHPSSDTLKNLTWRQLDLEVGVYGFKAEDTGIYRAPKGMYDAAVQKRLITEEYSIETGDTLWTVQPGDSAWSTISVFNSGDFPLTAIDILDSIPSNLIPQSPDFAAYSQSGHRLEWTIDTLKVGEAKQFSYRCFIDTLSQLIEQDMISAIRLVCAEDELASNDTDHDTLRYIPLEPANLLVQKQATGDSLSFNGGDSSWYVHPQGMISYEVTLWNLGEMPAKSITVKDVLPGFTEWLYTSRSCSRIQGDTLNWQIVRLNGHGASLTWTYTCRVDSLMPPWDVPLINNISVFSADDAILNNNSDCDTVIALGIAPPWPLIDASPEIVYPNDSVIIQVLSPFSVQSWDLEVIYADGSSNTSYADAFISATLISPNEWIKVLPVFTSTAKHTGQDEEILQFIFKTVDLWDVARNDTVRITVALPDLVVEKRVKTNEFRTEGGDTLWYAAPGETILYTLTLTNYGLLPCHDIQIMDILPPDLSLVQFGSSAPYIYRGDTLSWQLGQLDGQEDKETVQYSCQVKQLMPPWTEEEVNSVSAIGDRDNHPENNSDQMTIYVTGYIPPDPMILASPFQSEPGDSIVIQIISPIEILPDQWRLSVLFEDGTTNIDYAADYILENGLAPGDTLRLYPAFSDTRMRNNGSEERISFVLETIDGWQASYYDTAFVTLRSGDEFWLDRNVLRNDLDNNLGIRFRMSSNRNAEIMIYDIAGSHVKTVADGSYLAGWNQAHWDGRDNQNRSVGSGIYVALYISGDVKRAHKFIVVR